MKCLQLKPWKRAVVDCAVTAKVATVTTVVAAALCGQIEDGEPLAPINAVAHIAFGEEAYRQYEPSLKYTGTGILLHESAVFSWTLLHEIFFGKAKAEGRVGVSLLGGVLVSLAAYLADYHAVPERYKPGFERHLQPRSLMVIYIVLALALGLTGIASPNRKK